MPILGLATRAYVVEIKVWAVRKFLVVVSLAMLDDKLLIECRMSCAIRTTGHGVSRGLDSERVRDDE